MDITPRIAANSQIIQSYANAGFKIAGKAYQGSVLVLPDETREISLPAFGDLDEAALKDLIAGMKPVEVLLIGAGATAPMPPAFVRNAMQTLGLGVDVMDTGAACRTFNVLLTEGRPVAALLYPSV
jgi:uncharacterized protein